MTMQAENSAVWPLEEQERTGECPACGSHERHLLYNDLEDVIFRCAPGRWQLHQCSACRSAYLDPRPDEASIARAYETYFTHADADRSSIVDNVLSRSQTLRKAYNGRLNAKYGFDRQPSSRALGLALRLIPFIGHFFDPFGRAPPPLPHDKARLLDFGCGDGRFIKLAEEAGWDCTGIDFDPEAVAMAQADGLNVSAGGYEALEKAGGFDYITLSHVIEHVHQPRQVVEACFKALNPGGVLWMETPNIQSFGCARHGRYWRGLDCPRHLTIFSPAALEALMREAGFIGIRDTSRLFVNLTTYSASERAAQGHETHARSLSKLLKPAPIVDGLRTIIARDRREFIQISGVRPG